MPTVLSGYARGVTTQQTGETGNAVINMTKCIKLYILESPEKYTYGGHVVAAHSEEEAKQHLGKTYNLPWEVVRVLDELPTEVGNIWSNWDNC